MVQAVRVAAADAGNEGLVSALESIAVPQGMWEYRNPGKLIAEALGCPQAKSILAGLGVLQLNPISDLCQAIAAGTQQIGVVVGGEAKYRRLRATLTDQPVFDTVQGEDAPPPDVHHTSSDPWCSNLESKRGLTSPVEFFAILESAMRHHDGLSVEEHRDRLAALYAEFSAIGAANPHAWKRQALDAATIREGSPRNAMLAFPYTKAHASYWNVNQAVAILICSAAKARALGLDPRHWIYPLAGAQSKHVVPPAQMRHLHTRLGSEVVGERALALAGVTRDDLTAAELYSCFPAAIQSFARDLKIPARLPMTVTGSMAFAGGPFNNASLESVARMVEVLRDERGGARRVGLVSNLSGIFSKQACGIFANTPNPDGYRFEDVTADVAARNPPVAIDEEYTGPATVVGYTVVFMAGEPSHAIAVCDTPKGERTVVRSGHRPLLEAMMREEFCGRVVEVAADGGFTPAA
jgi:acetyl-CoA C-acetyltransferase